MNSQIPAIGELVITACECPHLPENNRVAHTLEKVGEFWICPNCKNRPFDNYWKSSIAQEVA